MHFRTNAAPTGSGKTYAATTFACERIPTGMKTAILQPTIKLCQQSSFDAKKRYPGCKAQIRRIVSDSGVEQKVSGRITEYLNTRDASGALLYITHAGFLRTQHWHRAKDWHLFLDEALDIAYYRRLRLKDHRHLLDGMLTVHPANNSTKYGILEAIDHSKLQAALAALPDDEVHEHFADMTSRLADGYWNVYVDLEKWQQFQAGKVHYLDVHGLLAPEVFERFASTTLMAANLTDTLMYRYYLKRGCTFETHAAIERGLQYTTHANGGRLVIKYLSEQRWSKTLRNLKVSRPSDDHEEPISVGSLYMEICQQEAAKHSNRPPLWISNNDVHDEAFDGVRLSNVPHGMNNLQDHEVCCIMSALNPPPAHRDFLMEMCGLNERELRRAILSQTAYQSCGRGILRKIDGTGDFLLIVPDHDTAIDIAQYYPGCRIEKLLTDYEMPKRQGRPDKYATDEERQAAKREQDRLAAKRYRVRKNPLLAKGNISDASGSTVSSYESAEITARLNAHAAQELRDMAEETQQYEHMAQGGFAASYWQNKTTRSGLAMTCTSRLPSSLTNCAAEWTPAFR